MQRLLANISLQKWRRHCSRSLIEYYRLPGYQQKNITAENWQFNAMVHPQGLVLQLVPDLKGSDSIVVNAHLNTAQNDLGLIAKSKRIIFGTNQIDSLNISCTNCRRCY